jgi:DNA-binding MarR family transcriptional regulator
MLTTLKRLALAAVGAFGLFATVAKLRQGKLRPDARRILKHLATNKSSSVTEVSSRLKLPVDEAARLLSDLEARGFVQLSGDQGVEHVRIAAITKAGRGQIP